MQSNLLVRGISTCFSPACTAIWSERRALGYSALDVGTLGISEVVTEPIEKSTSKQTIEVRVCYNGEQRVIFSERLENGNPGTIITGTMPPPPADSAPKPGN